MKSAFGILVSKFRLVLGTMEQRLKVVRDIALTCMVLHNMLRTHQGGPDRAPSPADENAALQSEDPSREAKNQARPTKRLL